MLWRFPKAGPIVYIAGNHPLMDTMPLRGSGYRWVARRRVAARQKREHKKKAMQDLHELRQRIFGDTVTPEIRKKAMAEIRAQAKSRIMELGQHTKDSLSPQTPQKIVSQGVCHEVTHKLEPSGFLEIQNPRPRKNTGR